jgi:LCP family protein required for cell wall assembly
MRYVRVDDHSQVKTNNPAAKSNAAVTTQAVKPKLWLIVGATLVFAIGLLGYYAWSLLSGLKVKAQDLMKAPNAIVTYVANKDPQVKNENGRVNIALLGIGGKGHDGPYLTDTMIVASVNIKNGNAVLLPLPRDIWVSDTRSKLNAVYAYGREKGEGIGITQAKDQMSKIVGIPIQYAVRVDFSGFQKAIDLVGGINVNVDTAFSDSQYPITGRERDMCGYKEVEEKIASESGEITVKKLVDASGNAIPDSVNPYACRYETLTYKVGPLQLSGADALKFVRSRHGTNNEGSDFARSRRQEKVISALKEKIFSVGTLANPTKVGPLLSTFGENIETDIAPEEYGEFFKVFQNSNHAKIESHSISAEGTDALLRVPADSKPYNGAYVLVPTAGANDWSGIKASVLKWIDDSEKPPQEATASASPK